MTQYDMPEINPGVDTGTDLAGFLNAWVPAIESSHAGAVRPIYAGMGLMWYDTDNNRPYYYNGVTDIPFTVAADLTGYLPLTGGTLSGPLGGTTAQFGGLAVGGAGTAGFSFTAIGNQASVGSTSSAIYFQTNARANRGIIVSYDGGLDLYANGAVAGNNARVSIDANSYVTGHSFTCSGAHLYLETTRAVNIYWDGNIGFTHSVWMAGACAVTGALSAGSVTSNADIVAKSSLYSTFSWNNTQGQVVLGNSGHRLMQTSAGEWNVNANLGAPSYTLTSGALYFEGSRQVYMQWDGNYVAHSGHNYYWNASGIFVGNVTAGGWLYSNARTVGDYLFDRNYGQDTYIMLQERHDFTGNGGFWGYLENGNWMIAGSYQSWSDGRLKERIEKRELGRGYEDSIVDRVVPISFHRKVLDVKSVIEPPPEPVIDEAPSPSLSEDLVMPEGYVPPKSFEKKPHFERKPAPPMPRQVGFDARDFKDIFPEATSLVTGVKGIPEDTLALELMPLIAQLWSELRETRTRLRAVEGQLVLGRR